MINEGKGSFMLQLAAERKPASSFGCMARIDDLRNESCDELRGIDVGTSR